jgi:hypothetical protein
VAIRGIENLTLAQVEQQLHEGACFVFYEYCISLVGITLRRPTDIYFLPPPRFSIWPVLVIVNAWLLSVAGFLCILRIGWVSFITYQRLRPNPRGPEGEPEFSELMCVILAVVASLIFWLAYWSYRAPDGGWKDETGLKRGVVYSLPSLFLGWWGVPWGIIYTPITIFTNLCGGQDVTDEVWVLLQSAEQ